MLRHAVRSAHRRGFTGFLRGSLASDSGRGARRECPKMFPYAYSVTRAAAKRDRGRARAEAGARGRGRGRTRPGTGAREDRSPGARTMVERKDSVGDSGRPGSQPIRGPGREADAHRRRAEPRPGPPARPARRRLARAGWSSARTPTAYGRSIPTAYASSPTTGRGRATRGPDGRAGAGNETIGCTRREAITVMHTDSAYTLDLRDVRGQMGACWALEIAAADGHNLLMMGRPSAARRCWRCACPGCCPLERRARPALFAHRTTPRPP